METKEHNKQYCNECCQVVLTINGNCKYCEQDKAEENRKKAMLNIPNLDDVMEEKLKPTKIMGKEEKTGFNKGEPNDLIGKLELALGCMIGSHTHNYTPKQQFEKIIKDLKDQPTLADFKEKVKREAEELYPEVHARMEDNDIARAKQQSHIMASLMRFEERK